MDDDGFLSVPLDMVKKELRRGLIECQKRGLMQSTKWLAEMNHGLQVMSNNNSSSSTGGTAATATSSVDTETHSTSEDSFTDSSQFMEGIATVEYDNYYLAKSYFDVREYDRAAYFVRNCESPVPHFLHLYATYMAREKWRLDSTTDQSNLNDSAGHVRDLAELLATLRAEHSRKQLDGYGMYLYGIVLKALNLNSAAVKILTDAIRMVPMLWGAYVELASLITEKEKLLSMNFGGHWMRHFFTAHTYIELHLNDEGLKTFEDLQSVGFRKCVYVTSQMALAYHNKRDVDKSIEIFQALQEEDPYRLENMDTFSNLLFVKELKTEMAQLAHKAVSINKYSPETCCIIGNYYSIRCDHEMAILYFQRALKLNPKYLAAWTLMGHEFMELKNTNAAIQSYRKAVEVNKRDYRAWYGLGQAYEILKMHYYSLYYFKIAHQLRPYDSRMLVALGETYEKLDKSDNAIKCYWKACDVGDIEGIAMYKLASLHEKLDELENAVECYILFSSDERAASDKQCLYHAYMTLANYYESKEEYDRASHYAYKCLESDDRKSEAKSLLKTIENKRSGKSSSAASQANLGPATDIATAETSSEDDMDIELGENEYKYVTPVASSSSSTAAAAAAGDGRGEKRKSSSVATTEAPSSAASGSLASTPSTATAVASASGYMSLNESDMLVDNPTPSTSGRRTMALQTVPQPPIAGSNIEGTNDDDDTNDASVSMHISID